MTFAEIFLTDGLYQGEDFVDGFAFGICDGGLYSVSYAHVNDIMPITKPMLVTKSLFNKKYKIVYNRQSLFK